MGNQPFQFYIPGHMKENNLFLLSCILWTHRNVQEEGTSYRSDNTVVRKLLKSALAKDWWHYLMLMELQHALAPLAPAWGNASLEHIMSLWLRYLLKKYEKLSQIHFLPASGQRFELWFLNSQVKLLHTRVSSFLQNSLCWNYSNIYKIL